MHSAFVLALLLLLLVGTFGFLLATLAYGHALVRKDLPRSPRRDSLMRWNFWTMGFACYGASVRAAFASPAGMSALSRELRSWSRQYLLVSVVLGTGLSFIPSSFETVHALGLLLSLGVYAGYGWQLQARTRVSCPVLAEAAGKTARATLSTLVAALGAVLVHMTLHWVWLVVTLAGIAVVAGGVCLLQLTRVLVMLGVETREVDESDQTKTGGQDTLYGVLWGVLLCAAALGIQMGVDRLVDLP